MKKNLIIILLVAGVAVGGIFVFSSKPKQGEEIVSSTPSAKESIKTKESKTNPANSLSLGGSYRCTYTLEEGLKVTTYIKNGKMRTEIPLENGDTNVSLYTDDKVYQWSEKEKQGIFMSVEDAKKQPGTEVQDPDEYLNDIKNKYHPDCKNLDLEDSLFTLPEDVRFQDLSEALKHSG
ncbi:MAG TPA: hypothetical protein P5562_01095 [Candidatus Woesebacteria bacterium]|nr:hypothetical protein [Candidatus Woesebacteria bacterium]